MRHIYYYIIPLLLTGCTASDDSMPDTEPTRPESTYPITFGSVIDEGGSVTRATSTRPANNYFERFHLYGYKTGGGTGIDATTANGLQMVFPGYEVDYGTNGWWYDGRTFQFNVQSGTTTTAVTTSQTAMYWDLSATAYRFYAWADTEEQTTSTTNNTLVTATPTMTPNGLTDYQNRTAGATLATTSPHEATLQFRASAEYKDEADGNYAYKYTLTSPYYSRLNVVTPSNSVAQNNVTMTFLQPFCRVRFILRDDKGLDSFRSDSESTLRFVSNPTFRPVTSSGAKLVVSDDVLVTYPMTGTTETMTLVGSSDRKTIDALTVPFQPLAESPYSDVSGAAWNHFRSGKVNAVEGYVDGRWYTVLAPGDQPNYEFYIDYNGVRRSVIIPSNYTNWQPCYQYTYVFKVTSSDVIFETNLYTYERYQVGKLDDTEW